jgi:hypothetical protein
MRTRSSASATPAGGWTAYEYTYENRRVAMLIPTASTTNIVAVVPGFRAKWRSANRRSPASASTHRAPRASRASSCR